MTEVSRPSAPLHQLQGRRRGEQLGHRSGVKASVQRAGRLPGPVGVPVGGGQDPLVASGHRDSAGEAGIRGQSRQRGLETGQIGYGTHNESIALCGPLLEASVIAVTDRDRMLAC